MLNSPQDDYWGGGGGGRGGWRKTAELLCSQVFCVYVAAVYVPIITDLLDVDTEFN